MFDKAVWCVDTVKPCDILGLLQRDVDFRARVIILVSICMKTKGCIDVSRAVLASYEDDSTGRKAICCDMGIQTAFNDQTMKTTGCEDITTLAA